MQTSHLNHDRALMLLSSTLKTFRGIAAALLFLGAAGLLCSSACGATYTWDPIFTGTGSDAAGTWNTSGTNWTSGGDTAWPNNPLTNNSDIAVIGAGAGAAGTITSGTTIDLNGITFNPAGSGNYTLSGGTLSFGGTAPVIAVNSSATINSVSLVSSGTGANRLTFNVAAGQVLTLGTTTWSTTGDFSKSGSGALTLTGANNESGSDRFTVSDGQTFTMSSGTMSVTSGGASYLIVGNGGAGTGAFTQTAGVFNYNNNGGGIFLGLGSGSAVMNFNGGTFNELGTAGTSFIGNGSSSAALNVNGGAVNLKSAFDVGNSTAGSVSISSGTLNETGNTVIGLTSNGQYTQTGGAATFSGGFNIGQGAGGGSVSVSGGTFSATAGANIGYTGSGSFTQTGGTVTISGGRVNVGDSANVTGSISVAGGTFNSTTGDYFILGAATSGTGALTVGGTGVVNITNPSGLISGYVGPGSITVNSGGTLNLTTAGTVYDGNSAGGSAFAVNGGTYTENGQLVIGNSSSPGTFTQTSGTTTINNRIDLNESGGTGTGALSVSGGVFTQTSNVFYLGIGAGAATLTVSGSAVVSFQGSGIQFYGGGAVSTLNLNGGTLNTTSISRVSATSLINFNSGTLQAGGAISIPSAITTDVQTGGAVFDTNGNSITVNGALVTGSSAGGGLTKNGAGTLTLLGANTYTGITTINAGTLQLGSAGTAGSLSSSGTIADNGTLSFDRTNTVTQGMDFSSAGITGTGGLTQAGSGQLVLNAANTYSGTTTISAGTVLLANANAAQDSVVSSGVTNGLSFSNAASSGTTYTIGGLSGSSNLALTDTGSAAVNLVVGNNNSTGMTYSGILSGAGSLTKVGTGVQTLSARNTYTGPTAINGGTLRLDLSAQTGQIVPGSPSYTIGSSGTMELYDTQTGLDGEYVQGIVFNGSGTINKTGVGDLEFYTTASSIANFTGQVNVIGGTLGNFSTDWGSSAGQMGLFVSGSADFDMRTGNVVINQLTGSGAIGTSSGATCTLSVGNNNGSATFSGSIGNNTLVVSSGAIALTKNGTGTQTLTGTNTYTGATTINAGTLQIGGSGSLGTSGTYAGTVTDSGTFIYSSSANQTLSASVTGAGSLTQSGPGTLTLANAGYSGATAVTSGTLVLIQPSSFKSTITTASGAATVWQQTAALNFGWETGNTIVQGAGDLIKTGAFLTYDDFGPGAQFMVQQSASGLFDMQAGTMQQGGTVNSGFRSTNLGSLNVASGATMDLDGSVATVDALTGAGSVTNSSGGNETLTIGVANNTSSVSNPYFSGNTATFSGVISSATLLLTKTGTGTEILTGSNTYTGATTINAGTLQIGNGGSSGYIGSTSGISGSSGGTLVYDLSSSGTISKAISGGIGFTQAGSGTLTLTNHTYSGATNVTGGTLIVEGNISGVATVTGGTLGVVGTIGGSLTVGNGFGAASSSVINPSLGVTTPGNNNHLTVNGNVTLNSDSLFEFTLNSTTGNSDYLNLPTGTLTLGGSITGLDVGNTVFTPFDTDQFVIAYAGGGFTPGSTFNGLAEGGLIQIGQNRYSIDYGMNPGDTDEVVLTAAAVPEPGTWVMMLGGLGLMIAVQRGRRGKCRMQNAE